jgi:hypothetical protein
MKSVDRVTEETFGVKPDMIRGSRHAMRALGICAAAVLCLLLAVLPGAEAQTGSITKDPTEILKRYVKLDANGARLEPLSWESQKPYINWKEEPAWGRVVVITGYTIAYNLKDWEVRGNLDVVIPVEFTVVGQMYWEEATFLREPAVERVPFHIKEVNGVWRIVEPQLPPHVERKRLINFVRQAALTETERRRVARLSELRDELAKAE